MSRIRPAVIVTAVIVVALVVTGMVLTIKGLPAQSPTQQAMLAWSPAAFAAAALVAIGEMVWERRAWRRRSFRVVAGIAGALIVVSVVGVVGDALTGSWVWARNGIASGLGWAGIGVLFVWLVLDSTGRDWRLRRHWIAEGEHMED